MKGRHAAAGQLRVIAGRFKGRRLRSPTGRDTRPASGRMRQAVMNTLGVEAVTGARALDLFAGTGAVGIEALSRGASSVVFVETSRQALDALRSNVADLGLERDEAVVLAADVLGVLDGRVEVAGAPFDIVFCDPPYAVFREVRREQRLAAALAHFAASTLVTPATLWVVEHPAGAGFQRPPQGMEIVDSRSYSAAGVSYLRTQR